MGEDGIKSKYFMCVDPVGGGESMMYESSLCFHLSSDGVLTAVDIKDLRPSQGTHHIRKIVSYIKIIEKQLNNTILRQMG